MALQGLNAAVKYESSSISMTAEATTTSDTVTYQVTDTAKRIFAFDSTIVVKDGGTTTSEDYTLSRLEGSVTFGSAGSRTITIDGDYVALTTLAKCKSWACDISADMLDQTSFGDEYKEFVDGLISGSVSLTKFYEVSNYYINMLLDGETKVIELYTDADDDPLFRVYGAVASDNLSMSPETLIEEGITIQVTDKMITEV